MFAWFESIITNNVGQYGLWAVFLTMILESACIPIPSEIVMPFAGHLVAQHKLTLITATLVGSSANLIGSCLAYLVGNKGGRSFIIKYGKYIFLSQKHLAWADKWFAERGESTVLIARMLPAVRTFISLPAGIAKMNFLRFAIYSFIGALPWNFALVYLGYTFSGNWDLLQNYLHRFNYIFYGIIFIIIIIFIYKKVRRHP